MKSFGFVIIVRFSEKIRKGSGILTRVSTKIGGAGYWNVRGSEMKGDRGMNYL